MGRGKLGKYLNEKRKSEMVAKPGLPKNQKKKKEKVQELKERIYRAKFRKRKHRCCWNNSGEDTCVNVYRVINEDTSGNPVYVDENGIIYNSIYKENCVQEGDMNY